MIITTAAVNAVAASVNIHSRHEATQVLAAALPHYRDGQPTPTAILAACHILYPGFSRYEPHVQQCLGREALDILRLATPASANQDIDEPQPTRRTAARSEGRSFRHAS